MKIVCIPAYNEGSVIKNIVKQCFKYADKVIVCDDGSSDDTAKNARNANALVIQHKHNRGKGAALRTIFDFVRKFSPDVVITFDGDGQFLTKEIPKVMQPILDGSADVVIGYRLDNTEMPSYRSFGNKMIDKMTNIASDLPFRDTQSGFRAYSGNVINHIQFGTDGFGADSEILVNLSSLELKIVEEPVTVLYDIDNKTSTKNPISHSSEVIVSLIQLVAVKRPLMLLGIPGLVFIILGIAYAIVVMAIFNDSRYFSIPSTLLTLGFLVIGLMMALMSIVLFSINQGFKRRR